MLLKVVAQEQLRMWRGLDYAMLYAEDDCEAMDVLGAKRERVVTRTRWREMTTRSSVVDARAQSVGLSDLVPGGGSIASPAASPAASRASSDCEWPSGRFGPEMHRTASPWPGPPCVAAPAPCVENWEIWPPNRPTPSGCREAPSPSSSSRTMMMMMDCIVALLRAFQASIASIGKKGGAAKRSAERERERGGEREASDVGL